MNELTVHLSPLDDGSGLALAVLQTSRDGDSQRTLGRAVLRHAIGLDRPRFWYHVGCTVHAAPELALFHRQRTLLLGNDHTGASELAAIEVDETASPGLAERAAVLRLLLRAGLLAIAADRGRWATRLVVELPGLADGDGGSPFWRGLGRHFYALEPAEALARHGAGWVAQVASLLPRHPVYTSFLPLAAQAAVGRSAAGVQWQREVLEEAGLRYGHHVGIVDGGPVLEADVDALPAIAAARAWNLVPRGAAAGGHWLLQVPGPGAGASRVLRVGAAAEGARLAVEPALLERLGLTPGSAHWAVPTRAADGMA